jgi:EAL domain-containing protein (putative c-di-GMP-specific phosphodiesterase class I)
VIDGNVIHTTASIGVVPYREDIPDADAMMSKADLALYRAKEEGRNQYRFHVAELDHQFWERVVTGRDLRLALARDEFELYYQPQMDLASGRVIGLEALIRWNHPAHGPMPPDEFIHIAETTGSIVSIGRWVVDRVCNQIRAWRDQGVTPPVIAINLSGAQFKLATNIGRTVADAIARAGIGPEQLELELTETVLMETAQKHNEALTQLRRLGVRLTIDDFGTGYSSLDYLRSFQPSRLKIDRRFVDDVTTSTDDAAIVRAIIGLAGELGIEVVAEGVETAGQRDFLLSAGCRLAQGNYFSAPVPLQTATEMLRQHLKLPRGQGSSGTSETQAIPD